MLGERIKLARKSSGLSMRALAQRAGVSAMAISKYESGKTVPSSRVLLALARALDVRTEYFLRPVSVSLQEVEYRKHPRLARKTLARIQGNVIEQIERFIELEQYLPARMIAPFKIPHDVPENIQDYAELEDVAVGIRKAWDLGLNPVPILTDTLEERGIKVFQSEVLHSSHFDGMAATVNGHPVIVVGSRWPGDRQRFTLAHELGHLVLRNRIDAGLDEEIAANRFAGAFLAPQSEVYKELGHSRRWLEPRELCVLKTAYGLSMQGWMHRAKDLGILTKSCYQRMRKYFVERGWDKTEPCDEYPREQPQLFSQLIFHALAENCIGEAKAAELLGCSLSEFQDLRNIDHSGGQATAHC